MKSERIPSEMLVPPSMRTSIVPYSIAPKPKSTFRKILPYAASIVILSMASIVFFSQTNTTSSPDQSMAPSVEEYNLAVIEENTSNDTQSPPAEEARDFFVAVNIPAYDFPASVDESRFLFYTSLQSLDSLQLGSLMVNIFYPHEVTLPAEMYIKSYSAKQINDSISRSVSFQ